MAILHPAFHFLHLVRYFFRFYFHLLSYLTQMNLLSDYRLYSVPSLGYRLHLPCWKSDSHRYASQCSICTSLTCVKIASYVFVAGISTWKSLQFVLWLSLCMLIFSNYWILFHLRTYYILLRVKSLVSRALNLCLWFHSTEVALFRLSFLGDS